MDQQNSGAPRQGDAEPTIRLANLPFEARPGDQFANLSPSWLARERKIFIDTSSFLAPSARETLLERLLPELVLAPATALVSVRTKDFLQDPQSRSQSGTKQAVADALDILRELISSSHVLAINDPHPIDGDKHDTVPLYIERFIGMQHSKGLCLITENEVLALQVIKNSRLGAMNDKGGRSTVKGVSAAYIENGQLKNWVPRLLSAVGASTPLAPKISIEQRISDGFKVIADTCSLMLADINTGDMRGPAFFNAQLFPLFKSSGNRLFVPERVIRELEKHSTSNDDKLRRHGNAGRAVLTQFENANLLVRGEDKHEVLGIGDRFADPVFVQLAARFQQTHSLCFITQDTELAEALLANRSIGNEQRFLVTFITMKKGQLALWEKKLADQLDQKKRTAISETTPKAQARGSLDRATQVKTDQLQYCTRAPQDGTLQGTPRLERQGQSKNMVNHPVANVAKPFELSSEINRIKSKLILAAQFPCTGTTVLGRQSGAIKLVEEIASGGEGTIYKIDREDSVCKIYHKHCLKTSRLAKIELMLSRTLRIDGVCWPTEIVATSSGEFVGYLMPKGQGKILKTAVFAKPLLLRTFPHWTRLQLTQLAITILQTIDRLHKMNIFIGDINPQNILVKDEYTIAIVDVDSFQIEGFPCPVGTETFTPAERQGQNYAEFLRSRDDELFAVATLLFMILFPGKAPYSSQGGGEASENIRNKRFAYGREADGKAPVGSWQFIWSHLHNRLKDVFTAVFTKGERVSIDQMVIHLKSSLKEMKEGQRSDELFPNKPRQREGATVRARCDSCPPDKAEQDISVALAERLRDQGRQFRCSNCSALRKIDRLESTREADCCLGISPQCYGRSAVNIDHLEKLKAQNRDYWCKPCARQRMQSRNSKCFVATATYCSQEAPEVEFLRLYRDLVLQKSRAGRCFIAIYYRVGPWLASGVELIPRLRPLSRRALDSLVARIKKLHPHLQDQLKESNDG